MKEPQLTIVLFVIFLLVVATNYIPVGEKKGRVASPISGCQVTVKTLDRYYLVSISDYKEDLPIGKEVEIVRFWFTGYVLK